ncbi:MAG: PadR family transcriptional regulator [Erythrobacter sp.]
MPRLPHTSKQAMVLFWSLVQNADTWHHGYGLIQATGMKSGTLYPLLIRLADDGFLESRWDLEGEGGDRSAKPRRLYRLTSAGKALAQERLARFAEKSGSSASGSAAC